MPMKRLLLFFPFWVCWSISFSANLSEFEKLYPGCVDNEESTIYGGTYGAWPSRLILPEFPGGGDVEFTRYIYNNVDYPEVVEAYDSLTNEPILAKGVVAIQIVIDRCGRATRQEIIQSVNDEYDQAALGLMNNLPIFKPGEMDGMRVKTAFIVPVRFSKTRLPKKEDEVIDFGDDYNFDDW